MSRLLVWLSGPEATVAHRETPGTRGRTACGQVTSAGPRLATRRQGFWIDWRLLDRKRVRLCQKCWSPVAVKLAETVPANLPPCEVES